MSEPQLEHYTELSSYANEQAAEAHAAWRTAVTETQRARLKEEAAKTWAEREALVDERFGALTREILARQEAASKAEAEAARKAEAEAAAARERAAKETAPARLPPPPPQPPPPPLESPDTPVVGSKQAVPSAEAVEEPPLCMCKR